MLWLLEVSVILRPPLTVRLLFALLELGLGRAHRIENKGGMARPDLWGCEQVKGGESATGERNRTGHGLGTEDRANASKTDKHFDWEG